MEIQNAKGLRTGADEIQGSAGDFDVDRWARLVASGHASWPDGLPAQLEGRLVAQVNHIRRRALLTAITKAIASDIACKPIVTEDMKNV